MSPASAVPAEIAAWLGDPGFTPGARHFAPLITALLDADRELARKLERVLARGGNAAARFALARLEQATARDRSRLLGVIGRVAASERSPELEQALLQALEHEDERVRRVASGALAKLDLPDLEARLLARWPSASTAERRSLAEALGKSGGERSLALLRDLQAEDPELLRIAERARLMLARDSARNEASAIALTQPLGEELAVVLHCRAGLASILLEEARALGDARVLAPGRVALPFRGRFGDLLRLRVATNFAIEAPLLGDARAELAPRVIRTLASAPIEHAVRAWTEGNARFRLAFASGGHQRQKTWAFAAAISEQLPWFQNDPHESTWQVTVDETNSMLELSPRRFDDPRFAYRSKDVPAASHPTIAAALARVAGPREDDVVWDPFTGSGLELIERARLGPYRALHGTDLDPRALTAARENANRAGVTLQLSAADATKHVVPGVTLIVTNPPMGRRVARDGSIAQLLEAFVRHAARVLTSGRLVWLSPLPDRTAAVARSAGFRVTRVGPVDMGGFEAELQRFER